MLEQYRRAFGPRLLLYDFASFRAEPLAILQAIESFMGLDAHFSAEAFRNLHMNRGDRGYNPWFSALLSAEPLIDAVSRLLPAPLMRSIARRVYGGEEASSGTVAPP